MTQVLRGATLIDGTGRAPIPNGVVVIDGERIIAVGPVAQVPVPPGASILDLSDRPRTILPGLIDCHDHFAHLGYDLAARASLSTSHAILRIAGFLKQTLEIGITTARDAGGLDYGFKAAVEAHEIPGPRLIVCLCIITPTGGLGDPTLVSGTVPQFPPLPDSLGGLWTGWTRVVQVSARCCCAGADYIKIATTGGVSSPRKSPIDPQFPRRRSPRWLRRPMPPASGWRATVTADPGFVTPSRPGSTRSNTACT